MHGTHSSTLYTIMLQHINKNCQNSSIMFQFSNVPGTEIEDSGGGMITAWPNWRPIYLFTHQHSTDKHMTVQPSCNNHWIHTKMNVSNAINIVIKQLHLAWPAGTKTWDLSASLWQHKSKGNALLCSISSLQTFLNNSQPLTVGWSATMYNFIALYNSTTNLLVCRL
jgi:hypothetical protein